MLNPYLRKFMKIIIKILFIMTLLGTQLVFAQEGTLKWKYFTGGAIMSAPAIGIDSCVYFTNDDFYALYPNGTVNWYKDTSGTAFLTSPVIAPDGTMYEDVGYSLAAFSPNGTVKWSTSVYSYSEALGNNIVLGADGTIYMSGADTTLRAFDSSGNQKWTLKLLEFAGVCAANPYNGTIYATSYSYYTSAVYAINPNGTIAWKVYHLAFFTGIAPDYMGNLYVGNEDGNLYCFTPWGTLKWIYTTSGEVGEPVLGEDGTIYFGSQDGNLYALNPNGSLKWKYQTGNIIDGTPTIGNDGVIYFGSYDDYVYALNPDGILRWKYDTGDFISSSPAIGSDGTLYIGGWNGYLYALYCSSTGLANSAWPKFQHDNQNTGLSSPLPTATSLFPDELFP